MPGQLQFQEDRQECRRFLSPQIYCPPNFLRDNMGFAKLQNSLNSQYFGFRRASIL